MNEKPKSAHAYSADITRDCETVFVILLRAFAGFKRNLRLIGGLVPRYLTPESPPDVPAHVGTTDVDVVLDVALLAERGAYDSLKRQLQAAGFQRYHPRQDVVSTWQWVYELNGTPIRVEFLTHTDDPEQSARLAPLDGEAVSACQILYAGLTHEWFEERVIQVDLPDHGGITQETIRYADAVAFIVLKALAFDQRHEPKDAADLIHVMSYWRDTETLADHFSERLMDGRQVKALRAALRALSRRFCDDADVEGYRKEGPAAFVNFHGFDREHADTRTRALRQVSGLVGHVLARISAKTGQSYLHDAAT
ncbi:hypothetical protein [Achromobacter kerstersii]|uniref:hypothetical protein n=1 Tax=Achromobacter kerstersii TaxID=1353890 RepID=UPI003CFD8588